LCSSTPSRRTARWRASPFRPVDPLERALGEHGDAVVALHAEDGAVAVSRLLVGIVGEEVGLDLDLLQAEDVRPGVGEQLQHQILAQPDRVDVPGGDAKARHVHALA
jgi:hypothetical protein